MVKSLSFDKNGVKKGAWSKEEDDKLRAYIQRYGHWNWSLLPKFAGLSRSGKSCRLRWVNYLRPNMKHGNFSKEEDDMIVYLHKKLGNKWSTMAAKLPGRSDNEIKNRWNTYLQKRAHDDNIVLETGHVETTSPNQANPKVCLDQELQMEGPASLVSDSSSGSTCTESSSSWLMMNDEFWSEPFLQDITSSLDSVLSPMNVIDNLISQSSCDDILIINNEFSWPMLDSYIESTTEFTEFINRWDSYS